MDKKAIELHIFSLNTGKSSLLQIKCKNAPVFLYISQFIKWHFKQIPHFISQGPGNKPIFCIQVVQMHMYFIIKN